MEIASTIKRVGGVAETMKPFLVRSSIQELAAQLGSKGLQSPALAAPDPIELAIEARRTWELTSQLAYRRLLSPALAAAAAIKPVMETRLERELAAQWVFREP